MRNARENQAQSFIDNESNKVNVQYNNMIDSFVIGASDMAILSFNTICNHGYDYCINHGIVKNEQNFFMTKLNNGNV